MSIKLNNKKRALPVITGVAIFSFLIGILVSSSIKISSCLQAFDNEPGNVSQPMATGDSQSFAALAEKLMPVTVNISTTKIIKGRQGPLMQPFRGDPFGDFFGDEFSQRFFGGRMPQREQKLTSLGSGFIIDKAGYIITNNHVIEGADEIKVRLSDKEEYDAKIIGRDDKTDIALIKIEPDKDLPVAVLGDSDGLKVGEWVMAIGNPFGLDQTVTVGVVSAKWRKLGIGAYEDFIQTDAAINQGNSGGPLFNTRGAVVGVNSAIFSTSGGNIGIGFAVPINLAKSVVGQLKDKGKVVRGWLGVVVQPLTADLAESFNMDKSKGALVADVDEAGPAARAGIQKGDIIISFDGKNITEMNELPLLVAQTPIGKNVEVTIIRGGKKLNKKVTIEELKESKAYASAASGAEEGLGMEVSTLTAAMARAYKITEKTGVVVTQVAPGSPADEAGMREGDLILEVNREPVQNMEHYISALNKRKSGSKILFLVKRGNYSQFVIITPDK
jgi:serine protease Do